MLKTTINTVGYHEITTTMITFVYLTTLKNSDCEIFGDM